MKSICIKTNNSLFINYLLNELKFVDSKYIFFNVKEFKNYKNIIIHYKGTNLEGFIHEVSCILSCLVIDEEEENLLKNIIKKNYFYFDALEKKHILEICYTLFSNDFNVNFNKKYNLLIKNFSNYLESHKSLILSGFINFRLKNYISILEDAVDEAVNNFIIEKEYLEFISLLKMYVNTQSSNSEIVHLIYDENNPILLDQEKNSIALSKDILNSKYLSDISFSSNDYILNSLLTLLPKKIYVHLVNCQFDDFINTLSLIFTNKLVICSECNICNFYKKLNLPTK